MSKADVSMDLKYLERLMDEFSIEDRHLELAAGNGSLGDLELSGTSNPGVNCTGGCN